MRIVVLATVLGGVVLTTIPAAIDWSPVLIWNASASAPIGLYRVQPKEYLAIPDLVLVMAPEPVAGFLAERGYLPHGVPLLKQILALPGQTVCRIRLAIMIDGVAMATARERDHRGRPLPAWQGCRMIAEGEVFLMNWQSADSLDGRYFGPLPDTSILGRAVPLWTFTEP
ncbi:S26 family signal peptidase [Methylocapsa sp. D3K7]|uniref:S26 family signal peptidase n=1 Tax=Methylocapsa sp. D3K7 TaxID=3041435 RepID=UPI00244EC051|nr:S26 family signal peptidase [Methylocapsa sp. D3K7]WGJ14556.1 S26 family signal peptidase [Methylocapsa sp. D3K7]